MEETVKCRGASCLDASWPLKATSLVCLLFDYVLGGYSNTLTLQLHQSLLLSSDTPQRALSSRATNPRGHRFRNPARERECNRTTVDHYYLGIFWFVCLWGGGKSRNSRSERWRKRCERGVVGEQSPVPPSCPRAHVTSGTRAGGRHGTCRRAEPCGCSSPALWKSSPPHEHVYARVYARTETRVCITAARANRGGLDVLSCRLVCKSYGTTGRNGHSDTTGAGSTQLHGHKPGAVKRFCLNTGPLQKRWAGPRQAKRRCSSGRPLPAAGSTALPVNGCRLLSYQQPTAIRWPPGYVGVAYLHGHVPLTQICARALTEW